MILTSREYPGELTETEFYSYMGKYFAEIKYRKEMPYLVNEPDYIWRLIFNGNRLIAFYHYTYKKDNLIEFGGLYVVREYRNQGVGKKILFEQVEEFKEYDHKSITNNPIVINIRRKLGFIETGKRGSYIILEKRSEEII